jgi:hypothetical protein
MIKFKRTTELIKEAITNQIHSGVPKLSKLKSPRET